MNYQECTEYILSIPLFAEKLGTDNLNRILDIMGHPERCYPVIHVAGTNGKGSTCSFLASILQNKGYRVGMFTSPHLIRLNERIRVNNDIISDVDMIKCCETVLEFVEKAKASGIPHPSFFEFIFLMSVIYFKNNKVDYAIIETGMGGRLDATNVVNPVLCIITSVGMDHMQYLGDTLEKIAEEKAGIIKDGIPVVFFDRCNAASPVIRNICKNNGGILQIVEKKQYKLLKITKKTIEFSFQSDYYKYDNLEIISQALYQVENAILAIRAYELLFNNIKIDYHNICNSNCEYIHIDSNVNVIDNCTLNDDLSVIKNGLRMMRWPGRMQQIADHIYVDGAHNEEAISAFCRTLDFMFHDEHKILLFAVSKDKDYRRMIEELVRVSFDEIIIVRYKNDRSADVDAVKKIFLEVFSETYNNITDDNLFFSGGRITTFDDMRTGFEYAKAHVEDRILFCVGSLYLVGDLLSLGV